eukprot:157190-Chlamydomonas_euryale.AAC.1
MKAAVQCGCTDPLARWPPQSTGCRAGRRKQPAAYSPGNLHVRAGTTAIHPCQCADVFISPCFSLLALLPHQCPFVPSPPLSPM